MNLSSAGFVRAAGYSGGYFNTRFNHTRISDTHRYAIIIVTVVTLLMSLPSTVRADFALRDRDTVVFLGDSITAARTYGKIIENYTLLRFPKRRVRFINAGWGGDTTSGGLKRLDKDVFSVGATVLIVAYGVNDIGWGTTADAEHKKIYLKSIREIVSRCKQRKVRVYICSAAVTAEDPATSENGFLQKMCDEGMAVSKAMGEGAIDVQWTMRAIQRNVRKAAEESKDPKDKPTLHAADGIHLNDLGQLAMAFAILKGLNAPAEVSSVSVDARDREVIEAKGCVVSKLVGDPSGVEFDRLDEGLPVNFGVFGALQFRFIPIPDELDRYMLTVKNLKPGLYEVLADGRSLGTFMARQLAQCVNICSSTADGWEPGGPWDVEAAALIHLTDARSELMEAQRQNNNLLPMHPARASLDSQVEAANEKLENLQRTLVRPRPFHFVVRLAPASP